MTCRQLWYPRSYQGPSQRVPSGWTGFLHCNSNWLSFPFRDKSSPWQKPDGILLEGEKLKSPFKLNVIFYYNCESPELHNAYYSCSGLFSVPHRILWFVNYFSDLRKITWGANNSCNIWRDESKTMLSDDLGGKKNRREKSWILACGFRFVWETLLWSFFRWVALRFREITYAKNAFVMINRADPLL